VKNRVFTPAGHLAERRAGPGRGAIESSST
jgi:hypothetical protein